MGLDWGKSPSSKQKSPHSVWRGKRKESEKLYS